MADRVKRELLPGPEGQEEEPKSDAALEEELDKASPKSPALSPRTKEQEGQTTNEAIAQQKAVGCVPIEEQPGTKRQKAAQQPSKGEDTAGGSVQEPCPLVTQKQEPTVPKDPTSGVVQPQAPKAEVTGDQRPEAPKKAKPTMPPEEKRAPATQEWIEMSSHQRLGLPEDEDTEMIHVSAPPLLTQVPATFPCSKVFGCPDDCVQCYYAKQAADMRQGLLGGTIPVEMFYQWWKANARFCRGKDPGPPPPTVPYRERLGQNVGVRLITWRNEENFLCKGTKADHERTIQETYRETSLDPEARQRGDDKEEERRWESAAHQNQPPKTTFGKVEETPAGKGKEARKEISERAKDRDGFRAKLDKAAQSAKAISARGSSQHEGSKAGPSAKVDLENSDSEHGGKGATAPPPSDHQARRATSSAPRTKRPSDICRGIKRRSFQESGP